MEKNGQLDTPAALLPEENVGGHRIAGRVCPRVGLGILENRNIPPPGGIQTPDCVARSPAAIPATLFHKCVDRYVDK